ncbi:MAG: hypothetical protein ACYSW3_25310 [Planctomycetota bacterium]
MNMIDLVIIVVGWLSILALNGGIRDANNRITRLENKLERQRQKNTMSDSTKETNDNGVEIEES